MSPLYSSGKFVLSPYHKHNFWHLIIIILEILMISSVLSFEYLLVSQGQSRPDRQQIIVNMRMSVQSCTLSKEFRVV